MDLKLFSRLMFRLGYIKKTEGYPFMKDFEIMNTKFKFWIADKEGDRWYNHEHWEGSQEFTLLKSMVKPHFNVLEFGTHYGFSAVFLAKQLQQNGRYVGIELMPKSAMYAQSQFKLNELDSRFRIINAAGSNKRGKTSYSFTEGGNSHVKEMDDKFFVQAVMGDDFLNDLGKVDLLKIDVEGYEVQVLEGCAQLLKNLPFIALEIHVEGLKVYGKSINDVFTHIQQEDYTGVYFHNPTSTYIRPDSHQILNFTSIEDLPGKGIINLFLSPIKR